MLGPSGALQSKSHYEDFTRSQALERPFALTHDKLNHILRGGLGTGALMGIKRDRNKTNRKTDKNVQTPLDKNSQTPWTEVASFTLTDTPNDQDPNGKISAPSQSSVTGAPQGKKRPYNPAAREFLASRGIEIAPKEKAGPAPEPEGDDAIWDQVAAELSEAPVVLEAKPEAPASPEAPVGPIGQTRKTEKPKKPRQPDAMYDALAQHAGITGSENGSVKNLLAEKGVAAEEVESAVHFMQTRCFVTPQASAIKLGSWKKHLPAYLSWRDSDHSAQDGIEAALGEVIYGGEIPTSAIYEIAKEAALMARDGLTGEDILAGVKALRAADHFKFRAGTTLDAKAIRQEVPKWKAKRRPKAPVPTPPQDVTPEEQSRLDALAAHFAENPFEGLV